MKSTSKSSARWVIDMLCQVRSLTDIHLTIPAAGDLADADLELVAGGGDVCWEDSMQNFKKAAYVLGAGWALGATYPD